VIKYIFEASVGTDIELQVFLLQGQIIPLSSIAFFWMSQQSWLHCIKNIKQW